MRRRHLRGVLRIEEAVNPRPWSLSLFLSELRYRDSRVYVVARSGLEIVGYAGLMLVVGDGHITNVGRRPRPPPPSRSPPACCSCSPAGRWPKGPRR